MKDTKISRRSILIGATAAIATLPFTNLTPVYAVDKVIDRRMYSDPSKNKYFVILCARSGGQAGHAFVVWGMQDYSKRRSSQKGFGFYTTENGKKVYFTNVTGALLNEATQNSFSQITDRLIVEVNKPLYDKTQESIERWKTYSYNLLMRNCVSFTDEVAKTLRLNVPNTLFKFPSDYLINLINRN